MTLILDAGSGSVSEPSLNLVVVSIILSGQLNRVFRASVKVMSWSGYIYDHIIVLDLVSLAVVSRREGCLLPVWLVDISRYAGNLQRKLAGAASMLITGIA